MSSTQTITINFPHSVIPLSAITPNQSTSGTPTSELPPRTARVFDIAPSNILSKSTRILITALVIGASLVQYTTNFLTLAGGLIFSQRLGRDAGPGEANWMPASYSLTQGAFVLISGRLGAVYGHQQILLLGGAFITVFSLVNAFCNTYNSFIAARALTGVGGGLIMPNAIAMITIMCPPGRSRNLTMGFFAVAAPVGGWLGAVIAGLFLEIEEWKMMFILIAGLSAMLFGGLFFLLPREVPVDKGGKIDYTGAFLGLSSLLLFNFVWNQAPSVGWSTPYEITCLITSVTLFAGFLAWENYFAKEPIMPLSIFRAPTFTGLVFVVLLSYMSFGISQWYMVAWQELLRDWTVLDVALGWTPFVPGAIVGVFLAAWLIPRVAAQWIMAIGVVSVLVSNLLLALMPAQQNYWVQTFPAVLIGSFCPDFVFIAAQVIASNSVGRRQQGVAGSLIGTLNLYGNSLGLGFAGTIETEILKHKKNQVYGYQAALFFGVALAVLGLILDLAVVRMPKDDREGWDHSAEGDVLEVGTVLGGAASGVENSTAA